MKPSRRKFLVTSGWVAGGVTVTSMVGCSVIPTLPTFSDPEEEDVLTWVQMAPDGVVRFYLPRAEMGQGISTGLTQVVAEELRLPMHLIECQYQSTIAMAPCRMTVGSQSVENYRTLTAKSAAFLREQLRQIAARKLDVAEVDLESVDGGFRHGAEQTTITYAQMLADNETAVFPLDTVADVELFSESDAKKLRVVGRSVKPVGIEHIVTGRETYSRDVHLEGMLFGAVIKPPQLGVDIDNYDLTQARNVVDVVKVLEGKSQIGVIAETPMALAEAISKVEVEWTSLTGNQLANIHQKLDIDEFIDKDQLDHDLIESNGYDSKEFTYSFRYDSPMVAHAAMEPRSGVASYRHDTQGKPFCEIWTGSQDPWMVQNAAAKATGLRKSRVLVTNLRAGGAFGGRVLCQASVEAAWLSKAVSQPVKVQWSREDEFKYNYVGPQFSTRIEASLDNDGMISHWHHRAVGAPILISSMFIPPSLHWLVNLVPDPGTKRGMESPYAFQNQRVSYADERVPMPTGPWRGLGAAPNTFAVECAMDELSRAANLDPIDFRIRHTRQERLVDCLKHLQLRMSHHNDYEPEQFGVAAGIYKGVTYVAMAVRTETRNGKTAVSEVICVHDCGQVLSPDQVRAQIEGNIVWGIGMALYESFELQGGIAATDNFDSYNLPRQADMPRISIDMINTDKPSSGAAEAAIAPAAAAITNAVFAETGQRRRQLPLV